ncbi:hypothetical protein Ahy_B06g085494 isoform D [Arachis hypogaea]|uniref:Uncharacterized protein n=1 Tax=Arachis hypogaea TaxID=3818 RepID=A0A444YUQ2_ARAHY|nr:hypothetical protein Ahy_B06g085494 isoform D [Arachis hypogaea]
MDNLPLVIVLAVNEFFSVNCQVGLSVQEESNTLLPIKLDLVLGLGLEFFKKSSDHSAVGFYLHLAAASFPVPTYSNIWNSCR